MADQDYITKTYTALKENLSGFNKTEQEFRDKVLSDPEYRGNVHKALSENLQGFQRTPEEFDSLVGVKKKVFSVQTLLDESEKQIFASPTPQSSGSGGTSEKVETPVVGEYPETWLGQVRAVPKLIPVPHIEPKQTDTRINFAQPLEQKERIKSETFLPDQNKKQVALNYYQKEQPEVSEQILNTMSEKDNFYHQLHGLNLWQQAKTYGDYLNVKDAFKTAIEKTPATDTANIDKNNLYAAIVSAQMGDAGDATKYAEDYRASVGNQKMDAEKAHGLSLTSAILGREKEAKKWDMTAKAWEESDARKQAAGNLVDISDQLWAGIEPIARALRSSGEMMVEGGKKIYEGLKALDPYDIQSPEDDLEPYNAPARVISGAVETAFGAMMSTPHGLIFNSVLGAGELVGAGELTEAAFAPVSKILALSGVDESKFNEWAKTGIGIANIIPSMVFLHYAKTGDPKVKKVAEKLKNKIPLNADDVQTFDETIAKIAPKTNPRPKGERVKTMPGEPPPQLPEVIIPKESNDVIAKLNNGETVDDGVLKSTSDGLYAEYKRLQAVRNEVLQWGETTADQPIIEHLSKSISDLGEKIEQIENARSGYKPGEVRPEIEDNTAQKLIEQVDQTVADKKTTDELKTYQDDNPEWPTYRVEVAGKSKMVDSPEKVIEKVQEKIDEGVDPETIKIDIRNDEPGLKKVAKKVSNPRKAKVEPPVEEKPIEPPVGSEVKQPVSELPKEVVPESKVEPKTSETNYVLKNGRKLTDEEQQTKNEYDAEFKKGNKILSYDRAVELEGGIDKTESQLLPVDDRTAVKNVDKLTTDEKVRLVKYLEDENKWLGERVNELKEKKQAINKGKKHLGDVTGKKQTGGRDWLGEEIKTYSDAVKRNKDLLDKLKTEQKPEPEKVQPPEVKEEPVPERVQPTIKESLQVEKPTETTGKAIEPITATEVKEKAVEASTGDVSMKEMKKDLLGQIDDVIAAMLGDQKQKWEDFKKEWGDKRRLEYDNFLPDNIADAEKRLFDAGFDVKDGIVTFKIEGDGIIRMGLKSLSESRDMVAKEFPATDKMTPNKVKKAPKTGAYDLRESELLVENLYEAERIGNKKLAQSIRDALNSKGVSEDHIKSGLKHVKEERAKDAKAKKPEPVKESPENKAAPLKSEPVKEGEKKTEITKEEDERIKNIGIDAGLNTEKYSKKVKVGTTGKFQSNVFKYEITNPFTGEKKIFDKQHEALKYFDNEIARSVTKKGREEIFDEINKGSAEPAKITYNDLKKEKNISSSNLKVGDYVEPIERSETKAKYDKYDANLNQGIYEVVKVNDKSIRLKNIDTKKELTVQKEQWHNFGKEINYNRFDKKQIDKGLEQIKVEPTKGGKETPETPEPKKEVNETKVRETKVEKKIQSAIDKLKESKIQKDLSKPSDTKQMGGVDLEQLWNDAIDLAIETLEKTKDFAKALETGLEKLKDATEEQREKFKGLIAGLKDEKTDFTKARMEEMEQMRLQDEMGESTRQKIGNKEEFHQRALDAIARGDVDMPDILKRAKDPEKGISPLEQAILGEYVLSLEKEYGINRTPENYRRYKEAVEANEQAGSTFSAGMTARQAIINPETSVASAILDAERILDVQKLTPEQEAKQKEWFDNFEKVKKEYEEAFKKFKAENEIKEITKRSTGIKRKGEEIKKERVDLFAALKKAHADATVTKMGYGFTLAEEKIIAKLIRNYVEGGINKLDEIVTGIYENIKDEFKGITKDDILGIVAGESSHPKEIRNKTDVAIDLESIRKEAKEIRTLESLLNGVDPKKGATSRQNKQISDTQKRINEIRKANNKKPLPTEDQKDASRLKAYRSRLETDKARLTAELAGAPPKPKPKKLVLPPDLLKLQKEVNHLRQQRKADLIMEKYNQQTAWEKVRRAILPVASGTAKALSTTADLSVAFLQLGMAGIRHPMQWGRAFAKSIKFAKSEKEHIDWVYEAAQEREWAILEEAGMKLPKPVNGKLLTTEELLSNDFIDKILFFGKAVKIGGKGYGGITKASMRQFVGMGDYLRYNLGKSMVNLFESKGMTLDNNPQAYKAATEWINTMTSKAGGGHKTEAALKSLGYVLWAPRLYYSQIKQLTAVANPQFMLTHPEVTKMVVKDYAIYVGATAAILAISKGLGADVEVDVASKDVLTIRVGNMRFGMPGGAFRWLAIGYQIATGEQKSTNTGKTKYLGEGSQPQTRGDILWKTARGKFSPPVSIITDAITGSTMMGDDATVKGELYQWGWPIAWKGLYESIKYEGAAKGTAMGVVNFAGLPSRAYPSTGLYPNQDVAGIRGMNALGEDPKNYDKDAWKTLEKYKINVKPTPLSRLQQQDSTEFKNVKISKEQYETYVKLRGEGIIQLAKELKDDVEENREDYINEVVTTEFANGIQPLKEMTKDSVAAKKEAAKILDETIIPNLINEMFFKINTDVKDSVIQNKPYTTYELDILREIKKFKDIQKGK